MLHLYYNASRDRWSEITEISYNIKRSRPRTEMNEGDKLMKLTKSAALAILAANKPVQPKAKRARTTKPRTRRAKDTVQV